jgi:hypothetical protein
MRVAPAFAALFLVAACAQADKPAPQAAAPAAQKAEKQAEKQAAKQAANTGTMSTAKARRVCKEEGAVTGSRTTPKRRCWTEVPPAAEGN